jgi:hypothetical protein
VSTTPLPASGACTTKGERLTKEPQNVLANNHQRLGNMVDSGGTGAHDPVLCAGRHHVPDRGVLLRPIPATRDTHRGVWLGQYRGLRHSGQSRWQWRQILCLLYGCHGSVCDCRPSIGVAAEQQPQIWEADDRYWTAVDDRELFGHHGTVCEYTFWNCESLPC